MAIERFCTDDLFRYVKLLTRDCKMDWSDEEDSICQFTIRGCNLTDDVDLHDWWQQAVPIVVSKIGALRNDRTTQVRRAFFCKWEQ